MLSETVRGFESVDLKLKVVGAPQQSTTRDIFQFDIWRSRVGEYFRIWPGARDNTFAVLDGDRRFRQVLLSVREPRRPFEQRVHQWGDRTWESVDREVRQQGGQVVRDIGTHWVVRFWTSPLTRLYLCGFDERSFSLRRFPMAGLSPRRTRRSCPTRSRGFRNPSFDKASGSSCRSRIARSPACATTCRAIPGRIDGRRESSRADIRTSRTRSCALTGDTRAAVARFDRWISMCAAESATRITRPSRSTAGGEACGIERSFRRGRIGRG
jgi:hypothetical protein